MKKILILILLALPVSQAMATDLGVYGRTYPIAEQNLLTVITERLTLLEQQGEIKHYQKLLKDKLFEPKIATDIPPAQATTQRWFDPSITYHQQRFNPLTKVSLETPLLFINGQNEAQIQWVENEIKQFPHSKVILIAGNTYELSKKWQRPVYFDQSGKLTQRLTIHSVPSRVTQEQDHLLIEEIGL